MSVTLIIGPASSHVRPSPPTTVAPPKEPPVTGYKRVLLKLSGEVFGGGKVGVDPDVSRRSPARSPPSPGPASRSRS